MKVMNFNEMLETRTMEVEAVVERYLPAADGYQKITACAPAARGCAPC